MGSDRPHETKAPSKSTVIESRCTGELNPPINIVLNPRFNYPVVKLKRPAILDDRAAGWEGEEETMSDAAHAAHNANLPGLHGAIVRHRDAAEKALRDAEREPQVWDDDELVQIVVAGPAARARR